MATDRLKGHIEELRQRPEHVRYNIAMGIAAGVTSLVALGWGAALATGGTLALKDTAPEPAGESLTEALEEPASSLSNLMGAAGAALGAGSGEAALDIIESETRTSSTLEDRSAPANATDKTVIPF
jgi:hypothetical protein